MKLNFFAVACFFVFFKSSRDFFWKWILFVFKYIFLIVSDGML